MFTWGSSGSLISTSISGSNKEVKPAASSASITGLGCELGHGLSSGLEGEFIGLSLIHI